MNAENNKILLFKKLSEIELLVADIYFRFSELFEEDRDFWWRLSIEERDHSALIRSGMEAFEPMNLFPEEIKAFSLDELDESIARKEELLKSIKLSDSPISRHDALSHAAGMEMSDIERCFQLLMDEVNDDSREHRLFRKLNKDSAEHAHRIFDRLKQISEASQ